MNIKNVHLLPLLLISLLVTTACGKRDGASGSGFEVTQSSIIVGGLDWEEITSLKASAEEAENALAVAHVDLPVMGSRCTGFLITEEVLMTNQHCIPTSSHSRGVTVSFNVVEGVSKGSEERFDCSEFIGNNQELDFALLKCKGKPGRKYGVVSLSSSQVTSGTNIYVIQQNCDYYSDRDCYYTKKISYGLANPENGSLTHDADTLGGSSGSPVFSQSGHKVVGIHHAGLGNNGFGRGVENYAVPMSKIVPFITQNFPSVFGTATQDPQPTTPNNDTFEGAGSLSLNKALRGSISSASDLDHFKFTLKSSQNINISLSISGSADLDLYVYDTQKNLLAKSESVKPQEVISGRASAGTYVVLVKGYKGAKGSYRLEVSN